MNKRNRYLVFVFIIFITVSLFVLNLKTTYYQGINYIVKPIGIPVYLKIIDFLSRHYHYQELVKEITKDCKTDQERVFSVFRWTNANITPRPKNLPIIDDHVWYVIIRGYGTDDQSQDVFTTLCSYIGVKAFFTWIVPSELNKRAIPISFIRIKDKWYIFDSYYGAYFKNDKGALVDIETIKSGVCSLALLQEDSVMVGINYCEYIKKIPPFRATGLTRASIQSPFRRILFEVKKMISK